MCIKSGLKVRAFAAAAHATLLKSGASTSGTPPPPRDLTAEASHALSNILTLLPPELVITSPLNTNAPTQVTHSLLQQTLEFASVLVADLIYDRAFSESDKPKWARSLGIFLVPWLPERSAAAGEAFSEHARAHFHAAYLAQFAPTLSNGTSEEGELLCDTLFSLAYGALLLLSHTTLRLFRGRRYGILGPNGSGKSTLMRSLKDGKVENFPPQEMLRTVMVEHSLQGEDGSLSVIDFIAAGWSASFRGMGPLFLINLDR